MLKSCSFDHKTKFNNNEKAAIRDTMAYIASTILLMYSYMPLHNFTVRDTYDLRPTSYEETVPSIENYMNQHLYYKQADLIMFRVIESRLTNIDPNTTLSFVHSASAALGAMDDWYYIFGGLGDLTGISGHDLDEEVQTGKYKYSTRGQRAIKHAVGPLDNIWSSFSYYGLDASLRYYFNQYGYLYRAFGYNGSTDAILNGEENISDDGTTASPSVDVPEVEVPEVEAPEIDVPEVSF